MAQLYTISTCHTCWSVPTLAFDFLAYKWPWLLSLPLLDSLPSSSLIANTTSPLLNLERTSREQITHLPKLETLTHIVGWGHLEPVIKEEVNQYSQELDQPRTTGSQICLFCISPELLMNNLPLLGGLRLALLIASHVLVFSVHLNLITGQGLAGPLWLPPRTFVCDVCLMFSLCYRDKCHW